jgi:2-polyprenyl-3-methyl-5-hydroxy-6-metoxy-1,4-benzoquinol methylase
MKEAESFYDEHAAEEWGRLERHRTEFAVTLKVLKEFLPPPPAVILDIGGGPGRYAIELAKRGYAVTLLDVSSKSLEFAKQQAMQMGVKLNACIHSNALDLDQCRTESYDAVLLMGPLYHLLLKEERVQAVHESMRVLKEGGRLFAAAITRFAPFREAARSMPDWAVDNHEYAQQVLATGLHEKPTKWAKAFFMHPAEFIPLMEESGLRTLELVGCEGIVAGHEDLVNKLEGEDWEIWVELNYTLGKEPSLHGASDHLLYVGEKSEDGS